MLFSLQDEGEQSEVGWENIMQLWPYKQEEGGGEKTKWLTLRLHHLYYPAEGLIFKHSNNVARLCMHF